MIVKHAQRRLTRREHIRTAATGIVSGTIGAVAGLSLIALIQHLGWFG